MVLVVYSVLIYKVSLQRIEKQVESSYIGKAEDMDYRIVDLYQVTDLLCNVMVVVLDVVV